MPPGFNMFGAIFKALGRVHVIVQPQVGLAGQQLCESNVPKTIMSY